MYSFVGGPSLREAVEKVEPYPNLIGTLKDEIHSTMCCYYRNNRVPNVGALENGSFTEAELQRKPQTIGGFRVAEDIAVICTIGLCTGHLATELTKSEDLWYGESGSEEIRCHSQKLITKQKHLSYPKDVNDRSAVDTTWEVRANPGSSSLSPEDQDEAAKVQTNRSPQLQFSSGDNSHLPKNVVITDYHYLLQFLDRILAVNRLSKKPVYEISEASLQGLLVDYHDPSGSTAVYYYTEQSLNMLSLNKETRDIWKYLLNKGTHEREHCTSLFRLSEQLTYTKQQLQEVFKVQADWYVSQGDLTSAAVSAIVVLHFFVSVYESILHVCCCRNFLPKLTVILKRFVSFSLRNKIEMLLCATWNSH